MSYAYTLVGKFKQDEKTFYAVHVHKFKKTYVFEKSLLQRVKTPEGNRLKLLSSDVREALEQGQLTPVYKTQLVKESDKAIKVKFYSGRTTWFPRAAVTTAEVGNYLLVRVEPWFKSCQAA